MAEDVRRKSASYVTGPGWGGSAPPPAPPTAWIPSDPGGERRRSSRGPPHRMDSFGPGGERRRSRRLFRFRERRQVGAADRPEIAPAADAEILALLEVGFLGEILVRVLEVGAHRAHGEAD